MAQLISKSAYFDTTSIQARVLESLQINNRCLKDENADLKKEHDLLTYELARYDAAYKELMALLIEEQELNHKLLVVNHNLKAVDMPRTDAKLSA